MAFQYIDAETEVILDSLQKRLSSHVKKHYISRYSHAQRCQVETVTIDMNTGYEKLVKKLFPKAKIIIDRFHLIQLVSLSMNQLRIQVMNGFKPSGGEDIKKYRRLKKYWKLLLKNDVNLTYTDHKYFALFGQAIDATVVETILKYNERLKVNYELYQTILNALKEKDF